MDTIKEPYRISLYEEVSRKKSYFDMTFRFLEERTSIDIGSKGNDQEEAKLDLIRAVSEVIKGLTAWRVQAIATPANELRSTFDYALRHPDPDDLEKVGPVIELESMDDTDS